MDCAPGAGAEDCITSARLRGLRSLAALVVVRLIVVPLPPRSPRRRCRVVGWADILLDAIGGVEIALREGCLCEDHDRCFSILVLGAFSTGVFNTNALPRINIVAKAGARLLCTSDGVCVIVYV